MSTAVSEAYLLFVGNFSVLKWITIDIKAKYENRYFFPEEKVCVSIKDRVVLNGSPFRIRPSGHRNYYRQSHITLTLAISGYITIDRGTGILPSFSDTCPFNA